MKNILKAALIILFFNCIASNLYASGYGGSYGAVFDNDGTAEYFSVGRIFNPFGNCAAAAYSQPAGIVNAEKTTIGFTVTKPFADVDGLKHGNIDIIVPLKKIKLGLAYSNFNVSDIREAEAGVLTNMTFDASSSMLRATAGLKLFDKLPVAAQFKLASNKIQNYSNSNLALDLGIGYYLKDFYIGGRASNILSTEDAMKTTKEKLPAGFEVMCAYSILEGDLNILGALSAEEQGGSDFKFGAKYQLFNNLSLQAGYIGESKTLTGGITFKVMKSELQYGVSSHTDLGLSHKFTAILVF